MGSSYPTLPYSRARELHISLKLHSSISLSKQMVKLLLVMEHLLLVVRTPQRIMTFAARQRYILRLFWLNLVFNYYNHTSIIALFLPMIHDDDETAHPALTPCGMHSHVAVIEPDIFHRSWS